jgi:predicted HTH transcriptional regulator
MAANYYSLNIMEWSDVQKLIDEGGGPRIDFKETPFLMSATNDLAADLTCFANRHGGYIIIGIKNDKTNEGAKIDKDKTELNILNIANNNCSPTLELSFDYFPATDGDVLVVTIHRRRGMH